MVRTNNELSTNPSRRAKKLSEKAKAVCKPTGRELTEDELARVSGGGPASDRPSESVSLNFTKQLGWWG